MAGRATVPAPSLELEFADGTYSFHLGLEQLGELQTKTGAGIGPLMARVLKGRYQLPDGGEEFGNPAEAAWHIHDLTETIRLGLIGGGGGALPDGTVVVVTPVIALRLVRDYVLPRPLAESWSYAAAILANRIEGYTGAGEVGDEAKKDEAPATTDGSIMPEPSPNAPR